MSSIRAKKKMTPRQSRTPRWALLSSGATLLALLCAKPAGAAQARSGSTNRRQIESFNSAKKALREIYADHRVTIYSGCAYDHEMRVVYSECAYQPKKVTSRALRIEWEHVVPAEAFGQAFTEWREGHPDCVDRHGRPFRGRHCAAKTSPLYRRMESDLHNLFPEVGELNARRSNFSMAELPRGYLLAGLGVKVGEGKFEPRPEVKGDVARTYLYMDQAYPGLGIVSDKNRKLFAAWSRMDPVDDWECERASRIAAVQGRSNAVVEADCARRQSQ